MMDFQLTGQETGAALIKKLVGLRIYARSMLRSQAIVQELRKSYGLLARHGATSEERDAAQQQVERLDEQLLQMRFGVIEFGRYVSSLAGALDEKASREDVLAALNVGHEARQTQEFKDFGGKTIYLIAVLHLENSATKDDSPEIRPLSWCCQRAMMNAMTTNAAFDRAVHDITNEATGGAFGEYQPRPLVQVARGAA